MNFKKFVSGVSAFTIAASAFASMVVVANAEEEPTVSANYVDAAAENYVNNVDGWTVSSGSSTATEWIEGTGVKFSSGRENGLCSITKTFDPAYTGIIEGSILWNVGTSTGNPASYGSFAVKDSNNVNLFELRSHGQSGAVEIVVNNEEISQNANTQYTRGVDWQINYTFNTVTKALYVFVDPDIGTSTWTFNGKVENAANVAKLSVGRYRDGGGNSADNTIKNYSLKVTPYSAPAGALTIKYVDENGLSLKADSTPDVTANEAGDVYKYAYPKYIANGGDLYKMTATNTRADVALAVEATEKTVTYKVEAEGNYYVYEFDGGYTTRADAESNGSAATDSATVTVPEDGEYTVTANCYGSAAGRTATITANDETIVDAESIAIWAGGTDLTASKIMLKAGDTIKVTTSDSRSGIDYVILQKTGEYVAPVTTKDAGIQVTTTKDSDSYNTLVLNITDADNKAGTATYTFDGAVTITKGAAVIYKITDIPEAYKITGSSVSYVSSVE